MNYITKFPYYEVVATDTNIIFVNKIHLDSIERTLVSVLDSHSSICKYTININDSSFTVSFNVGSDQLDAMIATSFQINIYRNTTNHPIIILSKEIYEHQQWSDVLNSILSKIK
jgi:hypothetical protein